MAMHGIDEYDEFYRRSVDDIEWFWRTVVDDELELEWFRRFDRVLDLADGPMWPHWFPGGSFNYVANAVDRHARSDRAHERAIVWEGEDGSSRSLTYTELDREVSSLAAGLRSLGVNRGDRVGIFMPMMPETAIATLACRKIGAIFIPIFSGYGGRGSRGAPARLRGEAAHHRRRFLPARPGRRDEGDRRRGRSPVAHHRARAGVPSGSGAMCPGRRVATVWWHELSSASSPATVPRPSRPRPKTRSCSSTPPAPPGGQGRRPRPRRLPDQGAPGHGPLLRRPARRHHLLVHRHGLDDGPVADRGRAHARCARCLLLRRHARTIPSPTASGSWSSGTASPSSASRRRPIRALMPHGDELGHASTTSRRCGCSARPASRGTPSPWRWYFRARRRRALPDHQLLAAAPRSRRHRRLHTRSTPIKPCSFDGPIPGMAADVVDEHGNPVRGEVGELVDPAALAGMTRGFWHDPSATSETYWSRFPDVWVHGDWATIDDDGYWFIQGRSDDTIKVAGKRLGPAEVESAAVGAPGRRRGRRDRRAPRGQGRERSWCSWCCGPVTSPPTSLRDGDQGPRSASSSASAAARAVRFVQRSAEDAQRQDHAPGDPCAHLGQDLGDLSSLENPAAVDAVAEST